MDLKNGPSNAADCLIEAAFRTGLTKIYVVSKTGLTENFVES